MRELMIAHSWHYKSAGAEERLPRFLFIVCFGEES